MKIHFIGIGGIGVSALAQYYLSKGNEITGSDLARSEITDYLEKLGIKISIGKPGISNLPNFVVYTPAVKQDNKELKFFKEKGVKCLSYPEALGELTKKYFTIAVSGAHGKSTTTAMLALIMIKAGLDPTVIVGTKLKEFANTNFRPGKSKYLVIEACEYDSSFLHYSPQMIVITNIDKEHLDYFKNLENILRAFGDFINKLPKNGVLVMNGDDNNVKKIFPPKADQPLVDNRFSIKQKEAKEIKKILKVPGEHNVYNALAALTAARQLDIQDKVILKALSEYRGSWRRFDEKELRIKNLKLRIINDYAHHPSEISATFQALREKYPKKRIWCVFQPHQHQRTYYLFDDFVKVFKKAKINDIIITDIYDVIGREEKGIKISSQKLVREINKKSVVYMAMGKIKKYILRNIKSGDVLVVMGAGDIYEKLSF